MRRIRGDCARRLAAACALLAVLSLPACAPTPVIEAPVDGPELPRRSVEGAAHYRVVDDGTRVYVRVFRGGRMASLGHNHVILFNDVRGDVYVAEEPGVSLFDLVVPVAGAVVDPPALRRRQGEEFATEISDNARTRTRGNMLSDKVLDAAGHPYVLVSSTAIQGSRDRPRVTLAVMIRGTTRQLSVPITLRRDDDELVAKGRLELLQSDFGIEPFTVLGGALRVKDRVELVFTIAASRIE